MVPLPLPCIHEVAKCVEFSLESLTTVYLSLSVSALGRFLLTSLTESNSSTCCLSLFTGGPELPP